MVILFAISMISFSALFAAVIAVMKHVHRTAIEVSSSAPRRAGTLYSFPDLRIPSPSNPIASPHQSVADISPRKTPDWRFMAPPSPTHRPWRPPVPTAAASPQQTGRKGPYNSHFGRGERLDWASFNKDLGDLRDPYEAARSQESEQTSEQAKRSGTR